MEPWRITFSLLLNNFMFIFEGVAGGTFHLHHLSRARAQEHTQSTQPNSCLSEPGGFLRVPTDEQNQQRSRHIHVKIMSFRDHCSPGRPCAEPVLFTAEDIAVPCARPITGTEALNLPAHVKVLADEQHKQRMSSS